MLFIYEVYVIYLLIQICMHVCVWMRVHVRKRVRVCVCLIDYLFIYAIGSLHYWM